MNIWATVTFGHTSITQQWALLEDEIGEDSQPHDYLLVMRTEKDKALVIEIEKQFKLVSNSDSGTLVCYLGTLHIGNSKLL